MARTSPSYPLMTCWNGPPAGGRRELRWPRPEARPELARGEEDGVLLGGQRGPFSGGAATEAAALALGQAAPDAEALVVGQRVLQALGPDLAAGADLLRLAGRAALLREERLGAGLRTQGAPLPALLVGVQSGEAGVEHACLAQHVSPV